MEIYISYQSRQNSEKKMTLHILNLLYFFKELSHCGLKYQKKDGL